MQTAANLETLAGARVVVTGAAGGIGREIVSACHRAGAEVVLVTRTQESGAAVADSIAVTDSCLSVAACDLSRPCDVAALARQIAAGGAVDVLFANAGVQPWTRTLTPDGIELAFATNVLSPFVLTLGLADAVAASRLRTVIATGSMVHRWGKIDWADLANDEPFDPQKVYARSKAELLLLMTALARRLGPRGIALHTLEPGMTRTRFARHFRGFDAVMARLWRGLMRDPADVGAEFAAFAARSDLHSLPDHVWFKGKPLSPAGHAIDRADSERLWTACAAITASL